MGVEGFDRLRVIKTAVHSATERRADDDRHPPVTVGPVAGPGGLADDLVKGRVDEVGELDLRDRDQAVEGGADRHTHDCGFRQGCVQHPRLAEARVETVGRAEYAAFLAHVFAQHEHPLVSLHLLGDRRTHGLDHPHPSHATNCGAIKSPLTGLDRWRVRLQWKRGT